MQQPSDRKVEQKPAAALKKLKEPVLIVTIASKGGVGKTTSTHNDGYLLSSEYKANVMMIDADPQFNLSAICMRQFFLQEDKINSKEKNSVSPKKSASDSESDLEEIEIDSQAETDKDNYVEEEKELKKSVSSDSDEAKDEDESEEEEEKIEDDLRVDRQTEQFLRDDKWFVQSFTEETKEQKEERSRRKEAAPLNNIFRIFIEQQILDDHDIPKFASSIKPFDLTPYFSDWEGGKFLLLPGSMQIGELDRRFMEAFVLDNPRVADSFFRPTDLIRQIARNNDIDIVLIDVNPGTSLLNHSLWSGCDFFKVPTEPFMYSALSLGGIARTLVGWAHTTEKIYSKSRYVRLRPLKYPKFLGVYVQKVPFIPKRKAETFESEENWINKIRAMMQETLLQELSQIPGMVELPQECYVLNKISRFDRAQSKSADAGYPIIAYEYYKDQYPKMKFDNCPRYKEEFFTVIDALLGSHLLRSSSPLSLSIQQKFQIWPYLFEKNYRALRRQFLAGYKNIPNQPKLSKTDEEFLSHLLYDYGADDIEKILFELRKFNSYQKEAKIFIGYPATSEKELMNLLDNQFFQALNDWGTMPDSMILPFYHHNEWQVIRICLNYGNNFARLSIMLKKNADGIPFRLGPNIQKFVSKLLATSDFSEVKFERKDSRIPESNQLGMLKCSGVVALSNIMDFIENSHQSNDDFCDEDLFFITATESMSEMALKRQQVQVRKKLNKKLNLVHDWFNKNLTQPEAQLEIQLLQRLSKNFLRKFVQYLPEETTDIGKIYRVLDRDQRFIPDSLSNRYQLTCLMLLISALFTLVKRYKTSTEFPELVEKRDAFFDFLTVSKLFKSFGSFLNWVGDYQQNAIVIHQGKLRAKFASSDEESQRVEWEEYEIPLNSNCGFSTLDISRAEVVDILLENVGDEKVREEILWRELIPRLESFNNSPSYLQKENPLQYMEKQDQDKIIKFYKKYQVVQKNRVKLYNKIRALLNASKTKPVDFPDHADESILKAILQNKLPAALKPQADLLIKNNDAHQRLLKKLSTDQELYKAYVKSYLRDKGFWLGLSSMKIVAQAKKINLNIWELSGKNIFDLEEIELKTVIVKSPKSPITVNAIIREGRFNFLVRKSYSAQPTNLPDEKLKSPSIDKINTYIGYDDKGQPRYLDESPISADGGSCGFRTLGILRQRAVEILTPLIEREDVRELLTDEILESLKNYYRYLEFGGTDSENPPTYFMEDKMQQQVETLFQQVENSKTEIEKICNQIRNKLDELQVAAPANLPDGRKEEYLIQEAKNNRFPAKMKVMRRDLIAADNQHNAYRCQLRDDKSIHLAYVESYKYEPGLWMGKRTMRILANAERIEMHIWSKTSRKVGGYREIRINEIMQSPVLPAKMIVYALMRRGHFNFLFEQKQLNESTITVTQEDQILRLSRLTEHRVNLLRSREAGKQSSALDKDFDQTQADIEKLEALLRPQSSASPQPSPGQKRPRSASLSGAVQQTIYKRPPIQPSSASSSPSAAP